MNKLYYCTNCINNGNTIVLTEWRKWGSMKLPCYKDAVINGFIDFPNDITNYSKCPHCNGSTVELSLTTDDWNILKDISTDADFILEMDKLKKSDIVDFNLKMSQFKANAVASKPVQTPPQSTVPRCPTCGSTNIKKISGTKRWVTKGMFGLGSSNVGKTMQCNSCGYKW